jgi:hypothetical protein
MPKDPKHDKHTEDADLIRKIEALKQNLGITHIPADTPGASEDELYPTDKGAVEFRLAKARKRRGSGGNYA